MSEQVTPQAAEDPMPAAAPAFEPAPAAPAATVEGRDRPTDESALVDEWAQAATQAALQAVASSAASRQLESMSSLVLDAVDLANRASSAHAAAGARLHEAGLQLSADLAKAHKQSKIVLAIAGGIGVFSLVISGVMVAQIQSRMAGLDATVLAVGKRFVEMNAGLKSLASINDTLAELQAKQEGIATLQGKLGLRLEEAAKSTQQLPEQAAKQADARTQALVRQMQSLDARVQAQAGALKSVGEQMKSLQGNAENVAALNRDVQALVTLQRERYLEAARTQAPAKGQSSPAAAPAPRGVQYPRPQPAEVPAQAAASGSTGPNR